MVKIFIAPSSRHSGRHRLLGYLMEVGETSVGALLRGRRSSDNTADRSEYLASRARLPKVGRAACRMRLPARVGIVVRGNEENRRRYALGRESLCSPRARTFPVIGCRGRDSRTGGASYLHGSPRRMNRLSAACPPHATAVQANGKRRRHRRRCLRTHRPSRPSHGRTA